ncbi:hypothetical protein [Nonomuraea dietziae]|uniref:hypothetical protein n=1 Tax=Nonomuraea dietziae TaxID=65515 RepID=UPI003409BB49
MRALLGFLPWIVYAIIATGDQWRYGAITGLVVAFALVAWDRRAGRAWDEIVIPTSATVFFAIITVVSFAWPETSLVRFGPALVNLWLAGTAWGSLLIRRPFTLGIARTMAPPEVQEHPVFYRVNAVITAVWAAFFTVAAVALAVVLGVDPHATVLVIAIKALTFALPALFTVRYPKIVEARYS